jgi:hypothetical protein
MPFSIVRLYSLLHAVCGFTVCYMQFAALQFATHHIQAELIEGHALGGAQHRAQQLVQAPYHSPSHGRLDWVDLHKRRQGIACLQSEGT